MVDKDKRALHGVIELEAEGYRLARVNHCLPQRHILNFELAPAPR